MEKGRGQADYPLSIEPCTAAPWWFLNYKKNSTIDLYSNISDVFIQYQKAMSNTREKCYQYSSYNQSAEGVR